MNKQTKVVALKATDPKFIEYFKYSAYKIHKQSLVSIKTKATAEIKYCRSSWKIPYFL